MKRYEDCCMEHSNCSSCSLSNYGRDCRNNPIKNLAYYRTANGLSQKALAEKSGCTANHIGDLERGLRNINTISAIKLYKIAKALGTTMENLLELDEDE